MTSDFDYYGRREEEEKELWEKRLNSFKSALKDLMQEHGVVSLGTDLKFKFYDSFLREIEEVHCFDIDDYDLLHHELL